MWWKRNADEYPIISRMAKVDILCVTASSVPSERLFERLFTEAPKVLKKRDDH